MKTVIALLIVFSNISNCDIEKVKLVNENLNNLTLEMIHDFLFTFDESCVNKIEYTEYSNETLFKVLNKSPKLFFKAFEYKNINQKIILEQIENPVIDFDLQVLYSNVKTTPGKEETKKAILKAILNAADKDKIVINK